MIRLRLSALALALTYACGGDDAAPKSDAVPDSDEQAAAERPSMSTTDDAAAEHCAGRGQSMRDLQIVAEDGTTLTVLELDPAEPVVGDNAWTVELTDEEGQPLTELADDISVLPFMPDHGHGTAVVVEVSEPREGRYLLAPVNLRMPGLWNITVSVGSAGTDPSVLQFDVCVE